MAHSVLPHFLACNLTVPVLIDDDTDEDEWDDAPTDEELRAEVLQQLNDAIRGEAATQPWSGLIAYDPLEYPGTPPSACHDQFTADDTLPVGALEAPGPGRLTGDEKTRIRQAFDRLGTGWVVPSSREGLASVFHVITLIRANAARLLTKACHGSRVFSYSDIQYQFVSDKFLLEELQAFPAGLAGGITAFPGGFVVQPHSPAYSSGESREFFLSDWAPELIHGRPTRAGDPERVVTRKQNITASATNHLLRQFRLPAKVQPADIELRLITDTGRDPSGAVAALLAGQVAHAEDYKGPSDEDLLSLQELQQCAPLSVLIALNASPAAAMQRELAFM